MTGIYAILIIYVIPLLDFQGGISIKILICDDDMIFIQQFRELVFQEFKQQRYFVEFRWCQNGTEMVNIISVLGKQETINRLTK